MTRSRIACFALVLCAASAFTLDAWQTPAPPAQPPAGQPQQQSRVALKLMSGPGDPPPRLAVPGFIALSSDAESIAAAATLGEVLWDDIAFEKEFYMIPRDTYKSIPMPSSLDSVPFDRWKELGAEAVVLGSVQKTASGVAVQFRVFHVATGQSIMGREYSGSPTSIRAADVRVYAHTIADEFHREQRALNGIARTKLAFTSDRDGERIRGPVSDRGISNLYISDYDGARQTRITMSKALDIAPVWAPDNRSLAFSSWRTHYQDVYVIFPYDGKPIQNPAKGTPEKQNYLPAFSPDGSKIAFTSSRDGNAEIYVMNRDGSGVQRLTNHPASDVTPTWSPTGTQIAFTSDRTGSPQIWIVNADGSGVQQITRETHCDRPTWSAAPLNEIAYASRSGAGNIIRIFDFNTRSTRDLTDAIGNNESPTFSPNGRHVAFVSSRAGRDQIFTIHRDGSGLRQVTRAGTNRFPNWSAIERPQGAGRDGAR
jgi:TolB protein